MTTITKADSSPVPVYTFQRYDPGNNTIQCDENAHLPVYTTMTTKGLLDILKKTLVVCETGEDKLVKVQGEIDWTNKKITVEGVSKKFSEVKHKLGGLLSLDIEWTWPSGKYTTTHKSGVWTVKRNGRELAIYTSLKAKAFSKNELATFKILVEIPDEEKLFLILALMFHDFQRTPVAEPRSLKEVAAEEGVRLATTVAVSASLSCCVIQ